MSCGRRNSLRFISSIVLPLHPLHLTINPTLSYLYYTSLSTCLPFLSLSWYSASDIHRSILISFTSGLLSSPLTIHYPCPCTIHQCGSVYIFPFIFTSIFLSHSIPLHFFKFLMSTALSPRLISAFMPSILLLHCLH